MVSFVLSSRSSQLCVGFPGLPGGRKEDGLVSQVFLDGGKRVVWCPRSSWREERGRSGVPGLPDSATSRQPWSAMSCPAGLSRSSWREERGRVVWCPRSSWREERGSGNVSCIVVQIVPPAVSRGQLCPVQQVFLEGGKRVVWCQRRSDTVELY